MQVNRYYNIVTNNHEFFIEENKIIKNSLFSILEKIHAIIKWKLEYAKERQDQFSQLNPDEQLLFLKQNAHFLTNECQKYSEIIRRLLGIEPKLKNRSQIVNNFIQGKYPIEFCLSKDIYLYALQFFSIQSLKNLRLVSTAEKNKVDQYIISWAKDLGKENASLSEAQRYIWKMSKITSEIYGEDLAVDEQNKHCLEKHLTELISNRAFEILASARTYNLPNIEIWADCLIHLTKRKKISAKNLNDVDKQKSSLMLAIQCNQLSILKFLLQCRVNANLDQNGYTALILAVRMENQTIVELLLEHGADANIPDKNGRLALHWAIHKGCLEIMKTLLRYTKDVNHRDHMGDTPLALAAKTGPQFVKLLLEQGADASILKSQGSSILHSTARDGYLQTLKILLPYVKNINQLDFDGNTALILAIKVGYLETTIGRLCGTGILQAIVELLLEHGADANIPDKNGRLALHWAAQKGCLEIMKALLLYTKDVNHRDHMGDTALILADGISSQFVKPLLERGADASILDSEGYTILHSAARRSDWRLLKILLPYVEDINQLDSNGNTALILIIKADYLIINEDYLAVIRELLDYGADVDIPDREGKTALSIAEVRGNLPIINILTEHITRANLLFRYLNKALRLFSRS